jgi:uncharacterized membrane protein YphA (DoxX/SURF4 family)
MNTAIWIITGLLALGFLASGLMKLALPKPRLVASGQAWAEDFSRPAVKAIGAVEVLGAVGLVAPALLDVAAVLVPLAATGLAALMVGAAAVHARRGEKPAVAVTSVLAALATFVALTRFSVS